MPFEESSEMWQCLGEALRDVAKGVMRGEESARRVWARMTLIPVEELR